MSTKNPGFNYYEIPFSAACQLPKGFGITKVTKDVIGFHADYFKEDGTDQVLHDVEIIQGDSLKIINKTLELKEQARIELRAEIAKNLY